jgi:hypothetical protein
MNITLQLFNKNDGTFAGTQNAVIPTYFLPTNFKETLYLEPDPILCNLVPAFKKYDCIVEVL